MHLTTTPPAKKTAPSVGVGRAENRVWDFFGDSVRRTWEIDPQVVEQHLEKTTTASRTASSVPHWPSRDPLGEEAFFAEYTSGMKAKEVRRLRNESRRSPYVFVGNCPISRIDKHGLYWTGVGAAIAARCALPYFITAHVKWGDEEHRFKHCWVSCMIARDCGQITATAGGLGKEVRDILVGSGKEVLERFGAKNHNLDALLDDIGGDWKANEHGLKCAGIETIAPGLGWLTRCFRESCEDC